MADTGAQAAGTLVNDATIGTVSWTIPSFANLARAALSDQDATDTSVRLVVGGTIVGDNKATNTDLGLGGTSVVINYGGETDLWGLSISAGDVNSSNFGFVFSATGNGSTVSQYLKFTNFSLGVPTNATIKGVKIVTSTDTNSTNVFMQTATLTVYYDVLSKIEGILTIQGISSITL